MDERLFARTAVSPMLRSTRLARRYLVAGGVGVLGMARHRAEAADALRRCRKCRGLARIGEQSGACPKGGFHAAKGSRSYRLWIAPPPPAFGNYEARWFECGRCRGIFWGNSGYGVCPAGGGHVISGGPQFVIKINRPPAAGEEAGWRYCSRCGVLFQPKGRKRGKCPAGGAHTIHPGYDYVVGVDS